MQKNPKEPSGVFPRFRQLSFLSFSVTLLSALSMLIALSFGLFKEGTTTIVMLMIVTLVGVFSSFLVLAGTAYYRSPTPLVVSLLGFPASGKTVFITVLFDELQIREISGIRFAPYGEETVEQVGRSLSVLSQGRWLEPTHKTELVFYRAQVSIGSGLFPSRFKLEIADSAGEHVYEFTPDSDKWLHKTQYFKQVIQSDALLICVDTEFLLGREDWAIEDAQNRLIAAFQIFAQEKGVPPEKRMKTPVALLFLKADLINGQELLEHPIEEKMWRLENICRSRCREFKVFFTSSVGKLGEDGSPPRRRQPFGVTEPIVWVLKTVSE